MPRAAAALITFVFVLSGVAALIFETLWFRQAGIAFGSSVSAGALVLSSFMAGTATGNGLAARFGHRIRRPIRFYAGLEVTIGIAGLSLVLALPHASALIGAILSPFALPGPLLHAARFAAGFVVLVVPAVAMGATLPTLVLALATDGNDVGRLIGRLYGWNTLGAVIGALASELLLLGALGITGTGFAAASLNGLAAILAFGLARRQRTGAAGPPLARPRTRLDAATIRLLGAAFLSGGVLLALEVVWFRILVLSLPHSPEAFAFMLGVVLCGIGLGGLVASLWLRFQRGAEQYTAFVALLSSLATLAPYSAFATLSDHLAVTAPDDLRAMLRLAVPLMLPASLLSGVLFTFLGKRIDARLAQPMRATGLLTLANTLGAGLGPLVGGFVLLPVLGMEQSLLFLACCYVAVAICALPATRPERPASWLAHAASAALLAFALVTFPLGSLESLIQERVSRSYNDAEHILDSRESITGTLTYTRADFLGEPYYYRLMTDGYSMSGNGIAAQRYMSLFVYLPFAFHAAPRDALLISYGVGTTADALRASRELESIDIVDISRATLEMSDLIFEAGTSPLDDPRVEVFIEDGRYFLKTTPRTYDLITAEPPPPAAAGIVNLYTLEYFALLRERLRPEGVVSYWLPAMQFSLEESQAIVQAFCAVFEDCTLWEGSPQDWILLGTRDATGFLSEAAVRRQWRDDGARPGLVARGVENAEQLGALFLGDAHFLAEWSRGVEPLVDNWPHRAPRWALPRGLQPHYEAVMESRGAAARFATSAFLAKMWPDALRANTVRYFEYEGLIRDYLMGRGQPIAIPSLHRLLRETNLVTLPLWMLGSDADKQAIVASLGARGGRSPEIEAAIAYHRGLHELASRAYGAAAATLVQVPDSADFPRATHLRLYALCMAGELAEASRLAAVFPDAASPQNDRYWQFLEFTFGVGPTRG